MKTAPVFEDILKARERVSSRIYKTPVLTCRAVDDLCGANLFFKCENFQKAGAFKIRGACNAVFSLTDEDAAKGVATHSSGNHAAALALAASWRSIQSHVVMPENAPEVKVKAVAGYGARITFCKPTLEAREQGLKEVIEATGATFIHPYNDYRVVCGQGTAGLEFCEEISGLDAVVAPVGGGGLLSGTAIAVSSASPSTLVFGAEPKGADDAFRSFHAGRIIPVHDPNTIADGLRTSLGDLTFPIISRLVKEIFTVSERGIIDAMRTIWERMKIIVEPSSAVPLAAVLEHRSGISGKRIGIILSGGNVDLEKLPWCK
ncbi:MAG: serine dehydratase [Deltaproteobacteria bacterium HGW-Deltaproteobacteria-15]|jgi:threonine dehydratase|nr:MAG: serine dehydratase [Deltaproteobacteria bacterium HGW-Deltaproteobacteria-15]